MSFFAIPGGAFTLAATSSALSPKKELPTRRVDDLSTNAPFGGGGALIGRQMRIQVVSGGEPVAFKWGRSNAMTAVAATDGNYDFIMQPGAIEEFNIPVDATHMDCITTTGSSTVYCEVGSSRP